MKILVVLVLAIASINAAPAKDFDLIAQETQFLPSLKVPEISGLYETPDTLFIPQKPVPVEPKLIETPEGLEQIDLRNSPSQDNEVKLDDLVPKNEVPSGLYEAPSQDATVQEEIPSGLYEAPSEDTVVENEIPTGLYETPSESSDREIIRKDEIVPQNVIPSGLYDLPVEQAVLDLEEVPETNEVDADGTEDSFLLQNIEDNVRALEETVLEVREPEVPSGLYEAPSGSVHQPSVLKPQEPELDTNQQILIESIQDPDNVPVPAPSPKSAMMGMPYDFDWTVGDEETGNSFSHVETSDGTTTRGEYRVLLPDGRTQVVTFFDNGMGFNAEVTYI